MTTAARPVVVTIENVSKKFVVRKDKSLKERLTNPRLSRAHREEFWSLRDINLEIEAGTTVGLLGANGSGKSTLLKVIGGIIQATTGVVRSRGSLAALLELGAGFHQDLTGRENVYLNAAILGLSREATDLVFDDIIAFSGIEDFIDTQVKFYSSGMYVRLAFSVAIHTEPDILLVDEVLAVGDEAFQRKCMDKIKAFQEEGRTIIFVSHSLGQVTDLCDRAVVLNHGVVVFDGTAVDAVNVLRDGFENEYMSELESGRPTARIGAMRILKGGRPVEDTLATGESFDIEVEVDSTSDLAGFDIGLAIESEVGTLISQTHTALLGQTLTVKNGKATIRFSLNDPMLGTGRYFFSAALHSPENVEVHRLTHGAKVSIESAGRSSGNTYIDFASRSV